MCVVTSSHSLNKTHSIKFILWTEIGTRCYWTRVFLRMNLVALHIDTEQMRRKRRETKLLTTITVSVIFVSLIYQLIEHIISHRWAEFIGANVLISSKRREKKNDFLLWTIASVCVKFSDFCSLFLLCALNDVNDFVNRQFNRFDVFIKCYLHKADHNKWLYTKAVRNDSKHKDYKRLDPAHTTIHGPPNCLENLCTLLPCRLKKWTVQKIAPIKITIARMRKTTTTIWRR